MVPVSIHIHALISPPLIIIGYRTRHNFKDSGHISAHAGIAKETELVVIVRYFDEFRDEKKSLTIFGRISELKKLLGG